MRTQFLNRMGMAAAVSIFALMPSEANDGVYVTSGNQLIPLEETSISISREVLTICLTDSGKTLVDVYYELYNHGEERTLLMGFEADPTYNIESELNPQGVHPYIKNFSVEMNGQALTYHNAVACITEGHNGMEIVDLTRWQVDSNALEINYLRDVNDTASADNASYIEPAYVYYFTAKFAAGLNRVHHTYTYDNSYAVQHQYYVPYKLTPASRWAGGKIGDFTLRIKAPHTAKYFVVNAFATDAEPRIIEGEGKFRATSDPYEHKPLTEIVLRNGTIEWQIKNFSPKEELSIDAADLIVYAYTGYKDTTYKPFGKYYDRGVEFVSEFYGYDDKTDRRILRNLPYASRGYVFHDKRLRDYFSKFYWYMPDATYKPSASDFTPQEQLYIQEKTGAEE